jgi:hypothetical protein
MDFKNIVTGIWVGIIVLVGAVLFLGAGQDGRDGKNGLGASVGPEVPEHMFFNAGLTEGGRFTIATTASAITLTDRDIRDAKIINISAMGAGQAALALTLPASTSWPSLTGYQEWIVDGNGTNAATTTTITPGAGTDLDGASTTDEVFNGGVSGKLGCWRLPSTGDIRCIVEEMVDAG